MTDLPACDPTAPIVLTGRGGSGTRLFSLALQQMGVFVGNQVNPTGDSKEWVPDIYRIAVEKLNTGRAPGDAVAALRERAQAILAQAPAVGRWGWKLPETMLILPEVAQAFPGSRIMQVIRHPLDTCLRRTHMTSRPDNAIGAAVLGAAYRALGWDRSPADDPDHLRNAASWWYQVADARAFFDTLPPGRGLTLAYEAICDAPIDTAAQMARFIGAGDAQVDLPLDETRRRKWEAGDQRAREVWDVCGELAAHYGYRFDEDTGGAA